MNLFMDWELESRNQITFHRVLCAARLTKVEFIVKLKYKNYVRSGKRKSNEKSIR